MVQGRGSIPLHATNIKYIITMELLIVFSIMTLLITLITIIKTSKKIKYYGGAQHFYILETKEYNYWIYLPKKDRPMPRIERGTLKTNNN